jgi:Ca2+-binding EF-hand superfamily protein
MKIASPFVLAALCIASTIQAQSSEPELKPVAFGTVDSNKDGKISLLEARANPDLYENFEMLDFNHDGFLTPSEFEAWPRAVRANTPARDSTTGPSGSSGAQHVPKEQ